jgi:hypothetical protein
MNIKEFQELLGLNQYRDVPLEHLDSVALLPMSKRRMETEIEGYLVEFKTVKTLKATEGIAKKRSAFDRLNNQSVVVASAWSDGVILLLDDRFVFLTLFEHCDESGRSSDSYSLEEWDPDNVRLPIERFGESALASLLHPAIAAEYTALSEAEENERRQDQADRLARRENKAAAKAWARYRELQAEMEALKLQIDGGAIDE